MRAPERTPQSDTPVAEPAPLLRVLVVDDNADTADGLGELLSAYGHAVQVAYDGPSALAVAPAFTPHVALLDIGLPVMDGYELGRRLRALPGCEALTLMAITGYGQPSDHERTRQAGFATHWVKPVEPAVLDAALRALVPGV